MPVDISHVIDVDVGCVLLDMLCIPPEPASRCSPEDVCTCRCMMQHAHVICMSDSSPIVFEFLLTH